MKILFVIIVLQKILKEKDLFVQNVKIIIYVKNVKKNIIKIEFIKENIL